jgi:hypothetical protein
MTGLPMPASRAPLVLAAILLVASSCKKNRETEEPVLPDAPRLRQAAAELKEAAGSLVDSTKETVSAGMESLEDKAPALDDVRQDLAELGRAVGRKGRSLGASASDKLERLKRWLDVETRSAEEDKEQVVGELRDLSYDLEAKLDALESATGRQRKRAARDARATLQALEKKLARLSAKE